MSVPVELANRIRDLLGLVHGGDFLFLGLDPDLDFAPGVLEATCQLKNGGRLGRGAGDVRQTDMLGRQIEIAEDG